MAKNAAPSISVIIHGDDLGISDAVNDAIFDLLARNQITSTTVLANGPRVKEAAARVHMFPSASFGAHLNLTQFEPLTREFSRHISTVRALSGRRRIIQMALRPSVLRAVYEEWCCQLDRLASLGFTISHIDSHKHIHTAPSLFPALKAVQRKYGIRKVRISRNVYAPHCEPSRALVVSKRLFNCALRKIYATRTTDAFTDFITFWKKTKHGSASSYRTIELSTHPGADGANEETTLLQSLWYDTIAVPIRLIPYWQL